MEGPADQQTSRPADQQASRPADQQTSRPAGQQASRPTDQQASRPTGWGRLVENDSYCDVPLTTDTHISLGIFIHKMCCFDYSNKLLIVYNKTDRLMAKWKYFPAYDYARTHTYYAGTRNNLAYIRISIHVPRPTQDRMNFSRFRRLISRSASSGSVPRHCYTLPLWYSHRGCLVFRSGMSVTDLPQIQSYIQPGNGRDYKCLLQQKLPFRVDHVCILQSTYR